MIHQSNLLMSFTVFTCTFWQPMTIILSVSFQHTLSLLSQTLLVWHACHIQIYRRQEGSQLDRLAYTVLSVYITIMLQHTFYPPLVLYPYLLLFLCFLKDGSSRNECKRTRVTFSFEQDGTRETDQTLSFTDAGFTGLTLHTVLETACCGSACEKCELERLAIGETCME